MVLALDMVQSIAVAVIVLYLGEYLVRKITFLEKYCIPAPVVGGIIFALLALILHSTGTLDFQIDGTLRVLAMTAFFTTVGFSASFKLLKKGGIKVFIFLGCAVVLVVLQDVLGVALAKVFNLNPLLGLATGSVPMTGGHGTSAAFGPVLEEAGAVGANVVALASATFGLIAGSMIGGPIGKRLIEKNNLVEKRKALASSGKAAVEIDDLVEKDRPLIASRFSSAAFQILLAMGAGTIISMFLGKWMTFPPYIGAMFAAAIIRNISDGTHKYEVPKAEIDIIGAVSLSLFLSMALMALKLWELADLALPMIVMVLSQTLLMGLFAYFITFNIMGRDYDAAVLAGGHCGFGLGATPNAIANMNSISRKFGPAPQAFFILPLIGSLFIDFFNAGIITAFVNFLTK